MRTAIIDQKGAIAPDLLKFINSLLHRLRMARRSDATINEYSYLLEPMGAFLTRTGRQGPTQVTMADLDDFWMELIDRRPKYEPATLQLRHNVIRLFIIHLMRQGGTSITQADLDDFEEMRPKSHKRLPQTNWTALYQFMVRLAEDRDPPVDAEGKSKLNEIDLLLWWRRRAIYTTLFATALRISEMLSIDRHQIVSDYVDVFGKGDKQHRAYMSPDALYFIEGYRSLRRDGCPALFVNHEWHTEPTRLSPRTVQRELNHDGQVWGIAGATRKSSLTPHKLRHLAAKMMLEETGNMEAVRRLLNHASISTTQMYANMSDDYLEATVRSQHPAFRPSRLKSSTRRDHQMAPDES